MIQSGIITVSNESGFEGEYKSVADASKETGISKTCISRACRGERENSGRYRWEYC